LLQKIATNTLSQVFSKFGTALVSIFLIGILTKYLPLEMYGVYNKVYIYLWMFAFLADLGLYTIAIREITENKSETRKIVGNILSLRVLLGIGIFFLSLFIALFIPGYDSYLVLWGIAIISIFTIVSLINSSILSLMQAYMKIEFSFVSVILGKILNILLVSIIVFLLFPWELGGDFESPLLYIFGAGLLWITLTTIMNYWYASKSIVSIKFVIDREYMKNIFRISLPYGLALFLGVVYFKVDVILLSILEPEKLADVSIALYSLPMKIVEVLMVLGWFYLNSILPSLIESFKKKDTKKIQKLIDISFKILISVGVGVFVFGTLLREHVIRIIANTEYLSSTQHLYSSGDVFWIVLAVLLFHFVSLVFIYILIAVRQQWKLLKINLIVTVFNIIWNMIIIPYYSFLGAGVVTVLSQILLVMLWYIVTRPIFQIHLDFKFLVWVVFLAVWFFIIGKYLLENYQLGLIADVLVYGWFLAALYAGILFFFLKREFSHR